MLLFFGCDSDSPSSPSPILGCMDNSACNYNEFANIEEECIYDISECILADWQLLSVEESYINENYACLEEDDDCEYNISPNGSAEGGGYFIIEESNLLVYSYQNYSNYIAQDLGGWSDDCNLGPSHCSELRIENHSEKTFHTNEYIN